MKLDEYQTEVVNTDIPLNCAMRVVANAGAGKSTTALHKVDRLIRSGVYPAEIVVVSFSRRSKLDLQAKWSRDFKGYPPNIATIHAFGLGLLKNFFKLATKLVKPYEQQKIVTMLLTKHFKDIEIKYVLYPILNYISYRKANDKDEYDFPDQATLEFFQKVYTLYTDFNTEHNYFDFDDLVFKTCLMLQESPAVLEKVRNTFTTYVVDESQDLNYSNWNLLTTLSRELRLLAIGDPCQNIYMFRYARPDLFSAKYLQQHFAQVLELSLPYNYRSSAQIVRLGNVIRQLSNDSLQAIPVRAPNPNSVQIFTEHRLQMEGQQVVRMVQHLVQKGISPQDICVITRTTRFINTVLERYFIAENLPYKILAGNNLHFHKSSAVLIFMAMLGLIVRVKNYVSFTSLFPYLVGMGTTKHDRKGNETLSKQARLYTDAILSQDTPHVHCGKLDDMVSSLYTHIVECRYDTDIQTLLRKLYSIQQRYVKPAFTISKSRFSKIESTCANFVHDFIERNPTATLREALHDMLVYVYDFEEDTDAHKVVLSTVHAQKGLESKVCIVCGFRSFGRFEDLGDENNILYVQMSRAKDLLVILRSHSLRKNDGEHLVGVENEFLTQSLDRYLEV